MDERVRPPESADERATLSGMLDFLRQTVVHKVSGLTDEQAFARPIGTTDLTAAGLVKHLTGVERFWFAIDFAAQEVNWPWTDENPHGNFQPDPDDTLNAIVTAYQAECARSRAITAAHSLDAAAKSPGMAFTLRYAVTHLIEETARHLGHLDLLREATDGQTGE
ncbi:DinB family protein [Kribbella monticola]|uniref:DinB family protein n=1 Tax=Kribbella monticola TaxID=2185285 RepID=UPI000DD49B93|nr:DinB family protein [Kribbella monticola]